MIPYTSDDYLNGIPCIYRHGAVSETVKTICLSKRCAFDGSRLLTIKFANGYITDRQVDGCQLNPVLYKM